MSRQITNPDKSLVLSNIIPGTQVVVETTNNVYVFLWQNLASARLIQCSNTSMDLGEVTLLGSYPDWVLDLDFEPVSSGQLHAGEHMLFCLRNSSHEGHSQQAVLTTPITSLRWHQPLIPPTRPRPGLYQPKSNFHQGQLQAGHKLPREASISVTAGSPELWTPSAPHIPKSRPPQENPAEKLLLQ